MKITIDTKEDSPEEIEKAIRLLQTLVSGKVRHSNIFDDDSSSSEDSSGSVFANMFGDDSPRPVPEPPSVEDEKEEEKKDVPEIMEY